MADTLKKIAAFLDEHHVLTLATAAENAPQCCNLFYVYLEDEQVFVVASDSDTEHMRNVAHNDRIAGTVVLETREVGKIRGLQFKGKMTAAGEREKQIYLNRFPYARMMNPTLWMIRLDAMKLTDNRLGFGKKLVWERL